MKVRVAPSMRTVERISMRARFGRVRLLERMRPRERIDRHAALDDARYGRERRNIAVVILRARCMAHHTEIGNGRRIAMAEPAGFMAAGEMRLQGVEPLVDPMAQPCQALGFVETELVFGDIRHPWE